MEEISWTIRVRN